MAVIGWCGKWVDLHPEVDSLTGDVVLDERRHGFSAADEAALEFALTAADRWGATVLAVSAGPPAANVGLRAALAAGASEAIRIDMASDAPSDSVAAGLCLGLSRGSRNDLALVCCGDWSVDRGSGSVPAFLARRLGVAQALGLLSADLPAEPGHPLEALRRLDRGRREQLDVGLPAVVSFEGAMLRLRRASLRSSLAARSAAIDVLAGPISVEQPVVTASGPYRPRSRVLAGPDPAASPRERLVMLSGALEGRTPPRVLHLEPEAAADSILEQLAAWGYLL